MWGGEKQSREMEGGCVCVCVLVVFSSPLVLAYLYGEHPFPLMSRTNKDCCVIYYAEQKSKYITSSLANHMRRPI